MTPAKLKPRDIALARIEEKLAGGNFAEGSQLPPERELAIELGVSRRALREALGQLEADGRIWRGVGRGTLVGPGPRRVQQTTTVDALTSPTELMEVRLALEPSLAALAAIHATTQDLEEIERCLRKSAGVSGHEGWDKWDGALHSAIGHATHNALVVALFELLTAARMHTHWGQLRAASLNPENQQLYTDQHRQILACIQNRDADGAARAMRRHLLAVRQTLLPPWSGWSDEPAGDGAAGTDSQ